MGTRMAERPGKPSERPGNPPERPGAGLRDPGKPFGWSFGFLRRALVLIRLIMQILMPNVSDGPNWIRRIPEWQMWMASNRCAKSLKYMRAGGFRAN